MAFKKMDEDIFTSLRAPMAYLHIKDDGNVSNSGSRKLNVHVWVCVCSKNVIIYHCCERKIQKGAHLGPKKMLNMLFKLSNIGNH